MLRVGSVVGALFLFAGGVVLIGCDRAVNAPPETFSAEDLQAARNAITLGEVSLMLRSGHNQAEIVREVKQRHLAEKPDARTEETVRRFGATTALLEALKNDANILTPGQQRAHQALVAEREAQPMSSERRAGSSQQGARNGEQPAGSAQQGARSRERGKGSREGRVDRAQSYAMEQNAAERQRKQQLADQTLQNAQSMQDRVTLYDKAHREYTIKKGQLENHIAREQAYINQARGRGASDEALWERLEELERNKKELSELKEPTR